MSKKKESEQLLHDVSAMRELGGNETLTDEDIIKQTRAMRTPGAKLNSRRITDYVERGIIPEPVSGRRGGYSVKRMFPRDTAAEVDASVRLSQRVPLSEVREARRLALILEGCDDYRSVIAREADFRGKEHYAAYVVYWLRMKSTNLKFLYKDYPRERLDYFEQSKHFSLVVWALTHGIYEGYRVDDAGNLIRPVDREIPDPERSIRAFPPVARVA